MSGDADKGLRGAHLDLAGEMSYGDYLKLDALLGAQVPLSSRHDELLFIIQHQTTELWMKLVLHELGAAREAIRRDDLSPAFKMLARVSRIMGQLIQAWDVLATLTPSEYMAFRQQLGKSSGFQSHQYRMIEFILGNKNRVMIEPYRHRSDVFAHVERALGETSLYDEALALLARRGFAIDQTRLARDWGLPYAAHPSVEEAWLQIYRDPTRHWGLYELAEEFVDLEDYFRQWRFRHVTTVERIIGFKTGTGGTAGVSYLKRMLDVRLFPELWDLRTRM
jgi:tryptophan 2,3-dioxygenase